MQYLRIEGTLRTQKNRGTDGTEADSKKTKKSMPKNDITSEMLMNSKRYNDRYGEYASFFPVDIIKDESTKLILVCFYQDTNKSLKRLLDVYIGMIKVELQEAGVEEITFAEFKQAINAQYHRDADDIFESLNLAALVERHILDSVDFKENHITYYDRDYIHEMAEELFTGETLLPELLRIEKGRKLKTGGIPVHYCLETDSDILAAQSYRFLLTTLYDNSRVENLRYTIVDYDGDDSSNNPKILDTLYRTSSGGTMIIRLHYEPEDEQKHGSSVREIIENISKIIVNYKTTVLTILCLPRDQNLKQYFLDNLPGMTFVQIKENQIQGEQALNYLKGLAKKNNIRTDQKLWQDFNPEMSYSEKEITNIYENWYTQKLKSTVFPQYKEFECEQKKTLSHPTGSAYEELMSLVGLTEAKKMISNILNFQKAKGLYRKAGISVENKSLHMVFSGNPGSCKTTVARLFAKIMKENNMLTQGQFIECGRSNLVGKYVGHTAPLVKQMFQRAKGGVLFIDEAYSLVDETNGSFGDEAINTIVQEMENHRDDVIVIFAGYPDKMEQLLNKNPGLRSRVSFHVPFEDYNTEELLQIAENMVTEKRMSFSPDAVKKLEEIFSMAKDQKDYGNGRFVRNVIERAVMAQASRIVNMESEALDNNTLTTIIGEDIETPSEKSYAERKVIGFCA